MIHRGTILVVLLPCFCGLITGCRGPAARGTDDSAGPSSASQGTLPSSDARAAPNVAIAAEVKEASELAGDGKLDAALSQIDRVLKAYPDHVPALLARARILMRMNRPGEAERSLRRAARLDPHDLDAKLMLGYCLVDRRQWEAAEQNLAEIAYGDGSVRQRVSAYLGLAFVYDKQGEKELMATCYREAVALDESIADILMQAERQFFWPSPVGGEGERSSRPAPSMQEIEKVIKEVEKTPP